MRECRVGKAARALPLGTGQFRLCPQNTKRYKLSKTRMDARHLYGGVA
jgi:hypothetical protein